MKYMQSNLVKINYELDNEFHIIKWVKTPFNENLPWIEIDNPHKIKINYDQIIDGKFVDNTKDYQAAQQDHLFKYEYQDKIRYNKQLLFDTDYLCLKHMDGALTDEEYEPIRLKREQWRKEINEYEQQLVQKYGEVK